MGRIKLIFLCCFANLLFFQCKTVQAQPSDAIVLTKNLKGKAKAAFEKGNLNYSIDPGQAIKDYATVVQLEPNFAEGWQQLGAMYYDTRQFGLAETAFEKVLVLDPMYSPATLFFIGKTEIALGKFDEAQAHVQQLLKHPTLVRSGFDTKAKDLLETAQFAAATAHPSSTFTLKRLDATVNSSFLECLPSISADGNTLVFTRRLPSSEDYFESKLEKEAWTIARPLDSINTRENEGGQTLSADGKTMIFTRCDEISSCDLWLTQYKNGAWSKPVRMQEPINSKNWESQPTLSPDGRSLFFASNRPGGFGGSDIYVSHFEGTRFGAPKNIGTPINTTSNEATPFIHTDGSTFYFASNGHRNLGGMDLFVVQYTNDSVWGEIQNLGYPINTFGDETGLVVARNGSTAYYATEIPGSKTMLDIYTFELPARVRARPTTYMQALVRDAQTQLPLKAQVQVRRESDGAILMQTSSRSDGTVLVCLPTGDAYSLNVSLPGYLFYSERFALTDLNSFVNPFLLQVNLPPITQSEGQPLPILPSERPVVLRNVFFNTGSATLQPASFFELDQLVALLLENKTLRIAIVGHTDNVGLPAANFTLSTERARSVYEYLKSHNIDVARLKYEGLGETQPMATNDTPEGRQTNRRTEFVRW